MLLNLLPPRYTAVAHGDLESRSSEDRESSFSAADYVEPVPVHARVWRQSRHAATSTFRMVKSIDPQRVGRAALYGTGGLVAGIATGYVGGWVTGMEEVLAVHGFRGWTDSNSLNMTPEAWAIMTGTMRWSVRVAAPIGVGVAGAAGACESLSSMDSTFRAVAAGGLGWGAGQLGGLVGLVVGAALGPIVDFTFDAHVRTGVAVGCLALSALSAGIPTAVYLLRRPAEDYSLA